MSPKKFPNKSPILHFLGPNWPWVSLPILCQVRIARTDHPRSAWAKEVSDPKTEEIWRSVNSKVLEKFEIMSINQLNAQIKLMEIWKLIKIEDYPLQIKTQLPSETVVTTRADANKRPCEIGVSLLTQNSCISDAIRIWNLAPSSVTNCTSLYQAKKATRLFAKSLPI